MSALAPLRPTSPAQVVEAIADARRDATPLEIIGGGALRDVGGAVRAAARLDLSALNAVIAYEPDELVLTIGAGADMDMINAMLAAKGQHLAFEPPDFRAVLGASGVRTLGGVLSANFGGPRRIKDGAPRDNFLGFEAVGGDAVAFKAGGRVVKNVTGFDLPKVLAGAWGTLAVLTSVTVKVLPRPQTSATLVLFGLDESAAVVAMNQALGWPLDLTAAAHLDAQTAARLIDGQAGAAATLFRLDGFAPSVVGRAAMLQERLQGRGAMRLIEDEPSQSTWCAIRDAAPFVGDGATLWRLMVPPASAALAVAQIRRSLPVQTLYDWGGALVWLAVEGEDAAPILQAARDHGGGAMLFRGPAALRERIPLLGAQSAVRARLETQLRRVFDPDGLFNPGRLGPAQTIG